MAFYVNIIKLNETEIYAQYQYSTLSDESGIMSIDKKSGDITVTLEAPNDIDGRISERAARALLRHWRKGEYPDKTCWAS